MFQVALSGTLVMCGQGIADGALTIGDMVRVVVVVAAAVVVVVVLLLLLLLLLVLLLLLLALLLVVMPVLSASQG